MFEKIKKALLKIEQEETKELKAKFKGAKSFNFWGTSTELKDKDGKEFYRVLATLTTKQQQKPLAEQKQILLEKEQKRFEKETQEKFKRLDAVSGADIPNKIEITIDWRKNPTWNYNPTATLWTDNGERVDGSSIGGCGYDKGSTATAQVLNKCKQIKRVVFEKLEKLTQTKIYKMLKSGEGSRDFWGYGLGTYGHGCLPSFDGGVGVDCHFENLNRLGYKTITYRRPDKGPDIFVFIRRGQKI